jgi:acetyl-CoA acetyltransferase family protein
MAAASPRPFTAYIVDAVRTAGGRRNGALSKMHPADLGAVVLNALLARNKMDGGAVDDVVFGCVTQMGAQAANIGRSCVLASKLPQSCPATTVDRQCGSSLQAIHFAAQAVMSGTQDVVIAAGVENMSMVPIMAAVVSGLKDNLGHPFKGEGMKEKYGEPSFSQFDGAELLATKYKLTKDTMDEFAYSSHVKAIQAIKEKRFDREIVPITVEGEGGKKIVHAQDEGVRFNPDLAKMKAMKPMAEGGLISAAASSQICDGSSAILICNERGLKKLGLKPRAKIVALGLAADDPVLMLGGPIPATKHALQKAGLTIDQIDLFEVNEAFASVPLAWAKALGADVNKLNVNGGACALGHPLGATGCKLTTTLLNELERRKARYGLLAICEGGGTANATIIERVTQWPPQALSASNTSAKQQTSEIRSRL